MAQETDPVYHRSSLTGPSPAQKVSRVYVNDRLEGTFICPACEKAVVRDVSEFSRVRSAVRIKCRCSCGNFYRVQLERRRHFRKSANLTGVYLFKGGPDGRPAKGLIRVQDISQSGVKFTINSIPAFSIGDPLTIEFTLDDRESSQIREDGIVKRIQANTVGLEFKTTDRYGRLGQYLFR